MVAAVAHVLEGSTDKWWRFDDETVTVMPEGPIGEKADHGVAAGTGPSGKKASFCMYNLVQLVCLVSAACFRRRLSSIGKQSYGTQQPLCELSC